MNRDALARKFQTDKSQQIGARISLDLWDSMADWFRSETVSESFLGMALDEIQDPQNVGSLIRTGHFFGGSLVLMGRDRSAPLSGSVAKASAGAIFALPIVRCSNLARDLDRAKEEGVRCIGLHPREGKSIESIDLSSGPILLVVGSEGEGLRHLTMKKCDELARVPGRGESLNAAVAGAVALYEVSRQRSRKKA
jgi:23S rRNA (guanosine2251-2'-O)-methyltransferase